MGAHQGARIDDPIARMRDRVTAMPPRQSAPTSPRRPLPLRTVAIAAAVATAAGFAAAAPLKAYLARRSAQAEAVRTPLADALLRNGRTAARRAPRDTGNMNSAQVAEVPMNLTFVDTARTP